MQRAAAGDDASPRSHALRARAGGGASRSRCPAAAIRSCCSTRSPIARGRAVRRRRAARPSRPVAQRRRVGARSARELCATRGVPFACSASHVAARGARRASRPQRAPRATRRSRGSRASRRDRRRARAPSRTTRRRRCCCSCCAARVRTGSRRCRRARRRRRPALAAAAARRCRAQRSTRTRRRAALRWSTTNQRAMRAIARNALRQRRRAGAARRRCRAIRRRSRAPRIQAEAAALLDDLARSMRAMPYDGVALRPRRAARARRAPRRATCCAGSCARSGLPAPSAARLAGCCASCWSARRRCADRVAHAGAELGVHRGRIVVHRPAVRAVRAHRLERRGSGRAAARRMLLRGARHAARAVIAARHFGARPRCTIQERRRRGERLRIAGRAPRAQRREPAARGRRPAAGSGPGAAARLLRARRWRPVATDRRATHAFAAAPGEPLVRAARHWRPVDRLPRERWIALRINVIVIYSILFMLEPGNGG